MSDDQPMIEVLEAADLSEPVRDQVLALFDKTYDQADHRYLLASIDQLGWIAIARQEDRVTGFAVGASRHTMLPGFSDPQAVALAGMGCIDPDLRQQGLFSTLALSALSANGVLASTSRFLFCGRMAHAITYRIAARSAQGTVPAPNQALSPWHQEVLVAIAELYGVSVDEETGVVIGKGAPIGFPRLAYEASEGEAKLFEKVDRTRGDSLLAVGWIPTPPVGWL